MMNEQNLIKIQTAKREHLEQVRFTNWNERYFDLEQVNILGFIDEWHALVVQVKPPNNRIMVVPGGWYLDSLIAKGRTIAEANAELHAFPQVFLD
jgi:hypothetical protein